MNTRKLKIKVCGMRETNNIRELIALQPDFIGFIFYPRSPRYIGNKYSLEAEIPGTIKRVGVFVNALIQEVIQGVNSLKLDYVQLHGTESSDYCGELTAMNIRIIKSFGIRDNFDFHSLKKFRAYCDYFLFDTKTSGYGGSGIKFDWNILEPYPLDIPFFLSGGIGPNDEESVFKLKKNLPLYALDINSKFETAPGNKNIERIGQFINTIRK